MELTGDHSLYARDPHHGRRDRLDADRMRGRGSSWRCLCVVLALLMGGLVEASAQELRDGLSPAYKPLPAPDLGLADVDGNVHRLADHLGEVVVINFWATWCPPCLAEMPAMQRMYDTLHGAGLEVFAVNAGEGASSIREFLHEFEPQLTFSVVLDTTGETFAAWRVRGLPVTYVVDRAGNIAYTAEGGRHMDSEHILGLLRELLAAQ